MAWAEVGVVEGVAAVVAIVGGFGEVVVESIAVHVVRAYAEVVTEGYCIVEEVGYNMAVFVFPPGS